MNKHIYVAGVALFVVTVAFLLTDWLVWQPGVTEANVRPIRPGMTLREVEAILGRPGNDTQIGYTLTFEQITFSCAGGFVGRFCKSSPFRPEGLQNHPPKTRTPIRDLL
jgi:hypothetical protein